MARKYKHLGASKTSHTRGPNLLRRRRIVSFAEPPAKQTPQSAANGASKLMLHQLATGAAS
jgi:hypothetical protein